MCLALPRTAISSVAFTKLMVDATRPSLLVAHVSATVTGISVALVRCHERGNVNCARRARRRANASQPLRAHARARRGARGGARERARAGGGCGARARARRAQRERARGAGAKAPRAGRAWYAWPLQGYATPRTRNRPGVPTAAAAASHASAAAARRWALTRGAIAASAQLRAPARDARRARSLRAGLARATAAAGWRDAAAGAHVGSRAAQRSQVVLLRAELRRATHDARGHAGSVSSLPRASHAHVPAPLVSPRAPLTPLRPRGGSHPRAPRQQRKRLPAQRARRPRAARSACRTP